jgi:hypothetical protein
VQVRLIYVGSRVAKTSVSEWIQIHPVVNPDVLERGTSFNDDLDDYRDIDPTDAEDAAWKFIAEHNLGHLELHNDKIQINCPNGENHRSGRDKNMSAFIKVSKGFAWCSVCQKCVGRTFDRPFRRAAQPSRRLFSSGMDVSLLPAKIRKLF